MVDQLKDYDPQESLEDPGKRCYMDSQDALNLKLAMDEPWYKEYRIFLMIPAFATLACCFLPVFHCEEGLSHLAIAPLVGAFSYGHTLAPRKAYYDKGWQKLIDYPSFVLGTVKKILLFAIPTGLTAWVISLLYEWISKGVSFVF